MNGTRRVRPIWSVGSPSRPISLLASQPSARPTTTATTAESTSLPAADAQEKLPVTAAAIATW